MKYKFIIGLGVLISLIVLALATKETKHEYSIYTKVKLEGKNIVFGKVKKDSLIRLSIPIVNITNQPLLISLIEKSNSTLVIDQKAQYFPVSKPIELTLLYQPNKIGTVKEYIILHGNFPEQQLKIPVVGEVVR